MVPPVVEKPTIKEVVSRYAPDVEVCDTVRAANALMTTKSAV